MIEDDQNIACHLSPLLREEGFEPVAIGSWREAEPMLAAGGVEWNSGSPLWNTGCC